MSQTLAFIDESGNNSFEFETQGNCFIVTAVICNDDNLLSIEKKIDSIRKKYNFQASEIKSSKIAKNHKRRINILKEFSESNFTVVTLIVDKKKLTSQGFKYKKSFYKYLNGILYKHLYELFPKLSITVDELGGNPFMLEFKKYVQKNHVVDLFGGSDFDMTNSKGNKLIQLADLYAGSMNYAISENKSGEHSKELLNILNQKTSQIINFPKIYKESKLDELINDSDYDSNVSEVAIYKIRHFLDTIEESDKFNSIQKQFLNILLLNHEAGYNGKYISTKEILNHINYAAESPLSIEVFRNKVVAKLRDKGIIISSNRSGYKIPNSVSDVQAFIRLNKNQILPMVERIKIAREIVKTATINNVDILDTEANKKLKKMIDKSQ
jgi:tetrahydromethanopterin S-methyltransferase subunit G